MNNIITPDNKVPLKIAAKRLDLNCEHVRRLARSGRLDARRDNSRRWWTTDEAICDFLNGRRRDDD